MTNPAVFWPAALGIVFLVVGIVTHRVDIGAPSRHGATRLVALGPVFVASGLAAFAGEHFTAAAALAQIVPKFLPGRLFIVYLVGVAHLAAASSFVARRYVRASSVALAVMFALFVLLMDLPSAIMRPEVRIFWVLVAREATYSIGALALFAIATSDAHAARSSAIANGARLWIACVLVFYGLQNILYPQFSPGVPDTSPTAAWIPAPRLIAYATGVALVLCGLAGFARRVAAAAAAWAGALLIVLTVALFVPQFFVADTAGGRVNAINFVFDTLLFAGTMLVIGRAIDDASRRTVASRDVAGARAFGGLATPATAPLDSDS